MTGFADLVPALIAARKRRGWTAAQVADMLGVGPSGLSHWEVGRRVPAQANAVAWCELLDVRLPKNTDGWFSRRRWNATAECGTRSGAQRHRRLNQAVCTPCQNADTLYARNWRAGRTPV